MSLFFFLSLSLSLSCEYIYVTSPRGYGETGVRANLFLPPEDTNALSQSGCVFVWRVTRKNQENEERIFE